MKPLFLLSLLLILSTKGFCIEEVVSKDPDATNLGEGAEEFTQASDESSHFLTLIDQMEFDSAWRDAAAVFQLLVPREIWIEGLEKVRRRYGLVVERKIVKYEHFSTLPGGFSGNFYRIDYRTQFQGGRARDETLVVMNIGYDQWRTISYDIK